MKPSKQTLAAIILMLIVGGGMLHSKDQQLDELRQEKNYWHMESDKQKEVNVDLRQQLDEVYFSTYCYEEEGN